MGEQPRTLKGLTGGEVDEAVRTLEHRLQQEAERHHLTLLIPRNPSEEHDAYWVARERVWAVVDREKATEGPGAKYWCYFGTTDPAGEPTQSCVFQINVQSTEAPWRTAGVFASDGRHTYYLHSGRLSNRPGLAERYPGRRATVAWPGIGKPFEYFIVARLEDRDFARQLGAYVRAVARFKDGATLAEEYRGTFERGLDEAIQDLQARIGGADQSGRDAGGGELDEAKRRLERLQSLQGWLRFDKYLLQQPVNKITAEVQEDRRRRAIVSVVAALASIGVGWLLSAVSPAAVLSALTHR